MQRKIPEDFALLTQDAGYRGEDAETGQKLFALGAANARIWTVAWSPNGERLAVASYTTQVRDAHDGHGGKSALNGRHKGSSGEQFLGEAVESVLGQTFSDFEFIIINDGSSDRTAEILAHYEQQDSRIVLASHANCGLPASLNRAISISRCTLLARMDGDDRALPFWLQKQIDFLARRPECSAVSSYAYFINSAGKRIGKAGNPVNVERGWAEMNPTHFLEIIHPTVLMRKRDVL